MPPSVIHALQCSPAAFKYITGKIYQHFQQFPIGNKVLCEKLGIYTNLCHTRQQPLTNKFCTQTYFLLFLVYKQ